MDSEEATMSLEQQDSLKLYHEVRATAKKRRDTCSCAMFATLQQYLYSTVALKPSRFALNEDLLYAGEFY